MGMTQGSVAQPWPAAQSGLLGGFLCMLDRFAHCRRCVLQDPAAHPDEFSLLEGAVTKLGRICAHVGSGLRPEGSPVLQRYLQVGRPLMHNHAPWRGCSVHDSHLRRPAPHRSMVQGQHSNSAAVPGTSCSVKTAPGRW